MLKIKNGLFAGEHTVLPTIKLTLIFKAIFKITPTLNIRHSLTAYSHNISNLVDNRKLFECLL